MEEEAIEQKLIKNINDRIDEIILFVAVALLGVSTTYIYDTYKLTGVALAWIALFFAFLVYDDIRIRGKNRKLESVVVEKKRFDELFLSQMIDNKVISGQDLSIPPFKYKGYYTQFLEGQTIEFLAFSQQKFTLFMFDSENYMKLNKAMSEESTGPIDLGKLGIQPEFGYDVISFAKNRHRIRKTDTWVFWFRGVEGSEKEEFKINLLISYV